MVSWPRRPRLEQWEITPCIQDKKEAHLSKDLGPPPPPLPPAEEPHIPKGRGTHMSSSMAALMAQFQQHHDNRSRETTPHGMPEKVPLMVPVAFGTLEKVATPKKLLQKKLLGRASRHRPRRALHLTPPPSHPSRSNKPACSAVTGGMILNMAT